MGLVYVVLCNVLRNAPLQSYRMSEHKLQVALQPRLHGKCGKMARIPKCGCGALKHLYISILNRHVHHPEGVYNTVTHWQFVAKY